MGEEEKAFQSGPVIIKLTEVVLDITEITIRPPKYKDLLDFELSVGSETIKFGQILGLAFKLSSVPKMVMEELCVKDAMKVVEVVSLFLSDG